MKPITIDFSDHKAATEIFDEAFQYPRRKYKIIPTDKDVATKWLRENANTVNFVWCGGVKNLNQRLAEGGPLHMGQLIPLDNLYGRERCGWIDYDGEAYDCNAPERDGEDVLLNDETGKRLCLANNCPIAHEADREDIRIKDPELYRSDYKPYPDETPVDWMVLHSRPRYAYVPNITVLGCEGWERWA